MNNRNLLALMVVAIIIVWLISGFMTLFFIDNWQDRGTFGDMFGAVNALFSGLAFAGLIYAVVLQKQDLELQKTEIKLNRAELSKSSKAQVASQKALIEQVEQMRIAARLNALNTIINYYNIQIANPQNSEALVLKFKTKRKEAIKDIDTLIDRQDEDFD